MPVSLQTSLSEWESALTRRFLMAVGEEVGPIRSFDISPETLALAIGADVSAGLQAVVAFRTALLADRRTLYAALEDGVFDSKLLADCLGCFAYLALTIYVDSQLDGDDAQGSDEFRSKLSSFLGVDRRFSRLAGIATMWRSLRDWLTRQAKVGKPFRRLILPEEDGWRQIGFSLRLSFPSRRDHTFLGNFFDQHPGITSDERGMLAALRNLVDRSNASPGLHDAFDEFYRAYFSGQRTLADHRFWKFVLSVAQSRNLPTAADVSLEIHGDEDGLPQFKVDIAGESDKQSVHGTLQSAVEAVAAIGPSDLLATAQAGFIVFKRVGNSRWSAAPQFSDCRGEVKVGLGRRLPAAIGAKLGRLRPSGDWSLTVDPVPIRRAEDALRRLLPKDDLPSIVADFVVTDGVRVGHHWLGRRSVLPRVASELGLPTMRSDEDADAAVPICEEVEPNLYSIVARRPLAGNYEVRSSTNSAKRLQFVANSFVHHVCAPSGVIEMPEWNDVTALRSCAVEPPEHWDDVPERLDDLLEAVYAGGRRGWSESDLIPLLERTLPKVINPWDFLRGLQDASALAPFLRARFRGRSWMLGSVTLIPLRSRTRDFVVLDGCVPALLLDDFRRAVEAVGGRSFRRVRSPWSVPLVGAVGAPIDGLGEKLGWAIRQPTMPGRRPAAFDDAPLRRLDAYEQAYTWSWDAGCFKEDAAPSPIRLARWVHRGGRDHDVYVVSGPTQERRFLSRCSAIVHAHILANRTMYRFEKGELVRVGRDGFLPDAISHWLRHANLVNAGPLAAGHYGYATGQDQAVAVASLLPGAIEAGVTLRSSVDAIASARRSGGVERLIWRDGRVTSGRTRFNPD
jgi:hypothetical protein